MKAIIGILTINYFLVLTQATAGHFLTEFLHYAVDFPVLLKERWPVFLESIEFETPQPLEYFKAVDTENRLYLTWTQFWDSVVAKTNPEITHTLTTKGSQGTFNAAFNKNCRTIKVLHSENWNEFMKKIELKNFIGIIIFREIAFPLDNYITARRIIDYINAKPHYLFSIGLQSLFKFEITYLNWSRNFDMSLTPAEFQKFTISQFEKSFASEVFPRCTKDGMGKLEFKGYLNFFKENPDHEFTVESKKNFEMEVDFTICDINNNGKLNTEELPAYITQLGLPYNERYLTELGLRVGDSFNYTQLLQYFKDKDGSSEHQLIKHCRKKYPIDYHFQIIDVDRNYALSGDQIRRFLQCLAGVNGPHFVHGLQKVAGGRKITRRVIKQFVEGSKPFTELMAEEERRWDK